MTTRIADLRTSIHSVADATNTMARIAILECEVEIERARAKRRINRIKQDLVNKVADRGEELVELRRQMAVFIERNRNLFDDPRTIVGEHGSFGLRKVTELVITDGDALLEDLMERGYDDCVKVERTILKLPVRERVSAGERLPGCHINSGDTCVVDVDRALLKKARDTAKE